MKRIAPHIRNKQGSMLMLTLIVFMVILILGMTMITSMLYSQGENTMQINKQKAYYAAQSAVEAVKSYFLNPGSDPSITPHDLIGATGTYNLQEQGIDEDTTVNLSISREEGNEKYILIEAKGTCQGEESTVIARMIEEINQEGGGGLYSSKVVLGSNSIAAADSDKKVKVIGNILVDDIMTNGRGIYMGGFDFTQPTEEGEDSTLFIRSEKSVVLQDNKLKDVFVQFYNNININNNKEMDSVYVQKLGENYGNMNFHNNTIKEEAQLFIGNTPPSILDNEIGQRLIVSATTVPAWSMQRNKVDEVYIKGAKHIGAMTGTSDRHIKVLYTDAITYETQSYYYVDQIVQKDLSFILDYEQKMMNVMEGIEETSKVLKEKPSWARPEALNGFIELGESDNAKDSRNWKFKEYYDPYRKIRLVFPDETIGYDRSKNYYIRKGENSNDIGENDYFISNDLDYEDDQIFFIAEEAAVVNFKKVNSEDKFEALYIYAPNAQCEIPNNFQYLKGSIIAEYIIIDASQTTFIFREPENIEGIGVPGSTSSSSTTSYKYYFDEYID